MANFTNTIPLQQGALAASITVWGDQVDPIVLRGRDDHGNQFYFRLAVADLDALALVVQLSRKAIEEGKTLLATIVYELVDDANIVESQSRIYPLAGDDDLPF